MFRERCADCHGAEAKGDRGPDLTGLWTSEAADARAFQIIRSGVPGSIMPPSQAPDEEIRAVVAYLRSISTTTAGSGLARQRRERRADFLDVVRRLSSRQRSRRTPRTRPVADCRESVARVRSLSSIRDASASIASGYEAVTLVTRDGQRIRGVRKGEDAFSIQIMDTRERLQGYVKADLREVSRDTQSLMPSFAVDRLSDADLDDLLDFLARFAPAPRPCVASLEPARTRAICRCRGLNTKATKLTKTKNR